MDCGSGLFFGRSAFSQAAEQANKCETIVSLKMNTKYVSACDPCSQMSISMPRVVQRVCDIQPTQLFGEFWSFTNDNALSDTAWTNTALGAHTDTTYFSIPAGIQVRIQVLTADVGLFVNQTA